MLLYVNTVMLGEMLLNLANTSVVLFVDNVTRGEMLLTLANTDVNGVVCWYYVAG
jgi:hypothetical protein